VAKRSSKRSKALSEMDDPSGGFLVRPQHMPSMKPPGPKPVHRPKPKPKSP
jgi:hypothetical protein